MCPACVTTVVLIAAGASSSGGLTALVIGALRARSGTADGGRPSEPDVESCSANQPHSREVS